MIKSFFLKKAFDKKEGKLCTQLAANYIEKVVYLVFS